MKTGVIDYGAGNLHSVLGALRVLDVNAVLVRDPADLRNVDTLVLPGVGACRDCAAALRDLNLWAPLKQWLNDDRPYLGICLGYQILFEESEEFGPIECLGHVPGKVVRFQSAPDHKVPHIGWNALRLTDRDDPLWTGVPAEPHVYFVHSYYPELTDRSFLAAETDYGRPFASAIRKGNMVATQFHPEKSQETGLAILHNFVKITRTALRVAS